MAKECKTCGIRHDPMPDNPLPCGCGVFGINSINLEGTRTENFHLHVKHCPKHAAVDDLLAACEDFYYGRKSFNECAKQMGEAIEKARGAQ